MTAGLVLQRIIVYNDSIISAISLNNGLNPFNKIKTEDEEKVKLDLSKLTTLLYHVCFSTFIETYYDDEYPLFPNLQN